MELLVGVFELFEKRLDGLSQEKLPDKAKESLRLLRVYLEDNRDRLCYAVRLAEGRLRQWACGRSVQELDREAIEADLGKVETGQTQSNGDHLCNTIQRTMEKLLEIRKIRLTNTSVPTLVPQKQWFGAFVVVF